MKSVFVADHAFEAHLVRGRLEADGIAAQVRGEWLTGAFGELPATGLVTVWVEDVDVGRAEALLAQPADPHEFDGELAEFDAHPPADTGVFEA